MKLNSKFGSPNIWIFLVSFLIEEEADPNAVISHSVIKQHKGCGLTPLTDIDVDLVNNYEETTAIQLTVELRVHKDDQGSASERSHLLQENEMDQYESSGHDHYYAEE